MGIICPECNHMSNRKEISDAGGKCPVCTQIEGSRRNVLQDLYNSFAGRGKPGFVAWLEKGQFLKPIEDDGFLYRYNDRCEVIEAMTGADKYPQLLAKIAETILEFARSEVEAT